LFLVLNNISIVPEQCKLMNLFKDRSLCIWRLSQYRYSFGFVDKNWKRFETSCAIQL